VKRPLITINSLEMRPFRHRQKTRHGIFEFDGETGDLIGFVAEDPSLDGDDLLNSRSFAFGLDGGILVVSRRPDPGSVIEYDVATGAKRGTFVPVGTGGMLTPRKIRFNSDGNLQVLHSTTACDASGVLEFDGVTGEFTREVVPLGSCGLRCGMDIAEDEAGHLYITDNAGAVFRFNAATGNCLGDAPIIQASADPLTRIEAVEILPAGAQLVFPWWSDTDSGKGRVTLHDAETGAMLAIPIAPPAGNVDIARASCFSPQGELLVAGYPDLVFRYDLTSGISYGVFASQDNASGIAEAREISFQPLAGDANGDWTIDLNDFAGLQRCLGADGVAPSDYRCFTLDYDRDGDVDAADGAALARRLTGPQ